MDDDLDTPRALKVLGEMALNVAYSSHEPGLTTPECRWLLRKLTSVLGVRL
jgi:hypothetical protein